MGLFIYSLIAVQALTGSAEGLFIRDGSQLRPDIEIVRRKS